MYLRFAAFFTACLFSANAPAQSPETPKIKAYFGVLHPIVTISSEKPLVNFSDYYAVGFPTGINLWKTDKIGFSFEFVPMIRTEEGESKMNSLLFHPGILVSLGHGFTFAGRLAFETSGRFGVTPVLNKTILKTDAYGIYVALPLPVRFGNEHPASFSPGFQFGISF